MDDDQKAAIEEATSVLDWAFGVWEAPSRAAGAGVHEPSPQREAPGERQQLGSGPPKTDEDRRELLTALGKRSKLAADAMELALDYVQEFGLEEKGLRALRIVAGCCVEDLVRGVLEAKTTERDEPCRCDGPVVLSESDDDGVVTVRCRCSAAWLLNRWLSETSRRIQASEAVRLGRPLTPWEAHSIDDQCYFRTLPKGVAGPSGCP